MTLPLKYTLKKKKKVNNLNKRETVIIILRHFHIKVNGKCTEENPMQL